jgi:pyruvate/2-oxoglutarate dehydrogenase complex dihydrolipoamide acyltransferase (E2) component
MTPSGLSGARAALAGGVLLLPWLAAADSQPQGGLRATTLRASAHLDFRIVIPRMLALQVDGAHVATAAANAPAASAASAGAPAATSPTADTAAPAQTVAVYGNGRSIALGATAADDSRSALILSAAARKAIAQNAVCAPAPVRGGARGVVCTASSP